MRVSSVLFAAAALVLVLWIVTSYEVVIETIGVVLLPIIGWTAKRGLILFAVAGAGASCSASGANRRRPERCLQ